MTEGGSVSNTYGLLSVCKYGFYIFDFLVALKLGEFCGYFLLPVIWVGESPSSCASKM